MTFEALKGSIRHQGVKTVGGRTLYRSWALLARSRLDRVSGGHAAGLTRLDPTTYHSNGEGTAVPRTPDARKSCRQMTRRLPCPAALGPLEAYAARFDDLFGSLAQRQGFREYLGGLLAPRERNTTVTGAGGGGAGHRAQHPVVRRLQVLLDRVAVGSGEGECLQAGAAGRGSGDRAARRWGAGDRRERDRKDGTKSTHAAISSWTGTAKPTTGGHRHHDVSR
jgi:hypothetical protein